MKLSDLSSCNRIAIWGLGKDGQETFREVVAQAPKSEVLVFDESDDPTPAQMEGRRLPFTSAIQELRNGEVDLLIRSPGVSIYRAEIIDLRKLGVPVCTSLDIWLSTFRHVTSPIVITGTKGKSTTSSLIYHILNALGEDVVLIGNIGIPVLSCSKPPKYTVIEASSYQVSDLTIGSSVAVVLNLYQEHIDWHQSRENYYRDKLRLFDLPDSSVRIACFSNAELRSRLMHRSDISWYDKSGSGFWVDDTNIMFGKDQVLNFRELQLRGHHNHLNACAALTAAHAILGKDPQLLCSALPSFKPLNHRLEVVGNYRGITFVNDSISTTTDSSLAAVRSFQPGPIILILGGADRGLQFSEFMGQLGEENVKHVFLIGDSGRRIFDESQNHSLPFEFSYVGNLTSAVTHALSIAIDGDAILLSPASPSYGEFRSFEARGELFCQLITDHFGS